MKAVRLMEFNPLAFKRSVDAVVKDFRNGYIDQEEAQSKLRTLEHDAFERYHGAGTEPDGEITYTVATAWDLICRSR